MSSRYYDPEVGRWMSPEPNVYAGAFDSGSGVLAYNVYVYCANNPVSLSDLTGEGIFSAVIGNELAYFLYILETVGLGSVLIWAIVGAVISTTVVMTAMKIYQMSKGGKQNIRDTGLIGTTDEEIESRIKDPSTSKSEKERLKKEQKARGYRKNRRGNK